jgi:hypothetical protein
VVISVPACAVRSSSASHAIRDPSALKEVPAQKTWLPSVVPWRAMRSVTTRSPVSAELSQLEMKTRLLRSGVSVRVGVPMRSPMTRGASPNS